MPGTISPRDREARTDLPLSVPRRLLIIEDDLDLLEILQMVFVHPEVSIQTAADGGIGLEKAWQWKPHVILLDLHLPSVRGVEILSALRRASFSPRIIVSSGLPRSELRVRAEELGAYDVLAKPADIDRARAVVLRALGATESLLVLEASN